MKELKFNINVILAIFFLDLLKKLGFEKENSKENTIDEDDEIPEL